MIKEEVSKENNTFITRFSCCSSKCCLVPFLGHFPPSSTICCVKRQQSTRVNQRIPRRDPPKAVPSPGAADAGEEPRYAQMEIRGVWDYFHVLSFKAQLSLEKHPPIHPPTHPPRRKELGKAEFQSFALCTSPLPH